MKYSKLKVVGLLLSQILTILIIPNHEAEAVIGVNWGRNNAQQLLPSVAVDLLLQNDVKEARIFTTQNEIIDAFIGSNIALTITIFYVDIVSSPQKARNWVQKKIVPYTGLVDIRRVLIGNQALFDEVNNITNQQVAVDSLRYVQAALNEAGYGRIKATFGHMTDLLKQPITRPSEAEFRDEIKEQMMRSVLILKENNAPFMIDMMPVAFLVTNSLDTSFAFADGKSTTVVKDNNGTAVYTNVFDFIYDSFVWSLRKLGVEDGLEIKVGMVGWPTDGWQDASVVTAERFFKYLLPHVESDKGTPLRPGGPIDIFVHALTDENKNPIVRPWGRHWGIYRSNGLPKYKIDLTGRGRDIYPTRAPGIFLMPSRWCVLDETRYSEANVLESFKFACQKADCTSLEPGGSCGNLTFEKRISYALNMYFQFQYQSEDACNFNGTGKVVTVDPSVMDCVFPVEVTVQDRQSRSGGSRVRERAIFLSLISVALIFL